MKEETVSRDDGNGEVEVKTSIEEMPKVTESPVLQKEKDLNYIGIKEFRSLKKAEYHKKKGSFDKSFVIKNKRTGVVAEIEAVNAFQACKFIGWKPKQVVLLETKDIGRMVVVEKENPHAIPQSPEPEEQKEEK